MSKTAKIVLTIIALLVVIAIIWAVVPKSQNAVEQTATSTENGYVASTTDTSDGAIDQDMSNLNVQLNDLNSQTATIESTSSAQQ